MPVFLAVFIIFGLTEAMFALSLRKIGFDQSPPERKGRVQGQMASALGIGFTLGPLLGGFIGKWFGADAIISALRRAGSSRLDSRLARRRAPLRRKIAPRRRKSMARRREAPAQDPFLASCLAICQSFFFLVGVTRVAFPFLAVNQRGIGYEVVGTMVSISRLTDTFGRYSGGLLARQDQVRPA